MRPSAIRATFLTVETETAVDISELSFYSNEAGSIRARGPGPSWAIRGPGPGNAWDGLGMPGYAWARGPWSILVRARGIPWHHMASRGLTDAVIQLIPRCGDTVNAVMR